ncbi:MAG: uracil-DNA glycosylase [Phreatobacter sp.]|uniref:uracil-DNA glycosylase n=1 Tax=Phreatobacter sp. TaxID=1966341 RepID=UPI001A520B79|nr:uracil-DNA glycosylase family protein [Phreatobacter sp.]MBL8571897.1 uracil-DNA glycosylase [Phreatobacter sp.]
MTALMDRDALEALLAFYRDAGVDAAIDEQATDWLAKGEAEIEAREEARPAARPATRAPDGERPSAPVVQRPQPVSAAGAPPAPESAVVSAREAARSAGDLDQLRAVLEGFDGCALKATASRTVFEDGARDARIMFVGEAPGRDEDVEGKPFVGRSGQLLDRMLASIGLDRRANAYIANIIPWRPPGNRTPTPQEIAICEPFIRRQIELKAPELLVCVGAPSTETLLGLKGIMKSRGRLMPFQAGGREIRAIATLHPAYLLRSPIAKRLAWRDMLTIRQTLGL